MATTTDMVMATAPTVRKSESEDPAALHWYVAYVRSYQERTVAGFLQKAGYEYYLPIEREVHQWSDRKKVVERLVIPRIIFVHTTEFRRRQSLELIPYLTRYMCDGGPYTAVKVRDADMEAFRMMVEYGGRKVGVVQTLVPGDKVRVVAGPLKGLECELVNVQGERCLAVHLGPVGTATIELTTDSVEKI